MKSITIKGSKRESVGKVATKALRNAGMVPCVIYGGENPIHFSAEEKAFKNLVFTPNVYTASINVDGQKVGAILQDIQFHPVTDRILHVDFYQLFDDKEVTMNIPVKLTGTSPGVLNGGSLRFTNRKLKIKALPANLPDFVTADISKLKIGNKLFVTSLFNDDYTFMHPDNTVVVQVRTSRNATVVEEDETEAAAPEAAAE
ncbi:50S ribosomal protein L25/general stress protein Ctc [Polaribacter sp. MSW13]|uniref:Large ribosomal subunit protein bL25 n=1 Tax=Polaribacter marinus TaxID=2916838 RepID=A0A9X1VPN9_9FLAO|nr:50S ribosomal protein L25/general stress protein Ctc [Polaribacter marinus]MCI2229908.1 50S ribosomal protein L25/general stress protein Ctc [Polaribacter marinus]